jgi:hypothetical protein
MTLDHFFGDGSALWSRTAKVHSWRNQDLSENAMEFRLSAAASGHARARQSAIWRDLIDHIESLLRHSSLLVKLRLRLRSLHRIRRRR